MNNSLSALRALVYFDLFDYPLTREEIGLFMDKKASAAEVETSIEELTESGLVFPYAQYYCLKHPEALAKRREAGNELASELLEKAYRISGFLYHFPFIRGIGISGSLSKNFATEKADIDYFIITKSNRLWIARTLMHLFKKLTFLVGRQHWYCLNYYVDEEALCIQEKNVFTAIEVATLIPVCGNGSMENFFTANAWIENYYPNYMLDVESRKNSKHSKLKKFLEFLIDLLPANKLDNYLMRLTARRWKQKEEKNRRSVAGRKMGLHTSKHFSKPNPQYFQQSVVAQFEQRCKESKEKFRVSGLGFSV